MAFTVARGRTPLLPMGRRENHFIDHRNWIIEKLVLTNQKGQGGHICTF